MGLLWAALLITVLCIVYLFDRMKRVELGWHKETTDLVNIVNHLYASILRPRPIELESIKAQDAGVPLN